MLTILRHTELTSTYSITNSWLTYASCFGIVLSYGGPQTAVFGVMCSAVAQWIVLLGLAELGSAMPSSGVRPAPCPSKKFTIDRTPGPVSLHLHHCAKVNSKIRSLHRRRHQHSCLVGGYSFRYHIHSYLGLRHRRLLGSHLQRYAVASVPVLSSGDNNHS